MPRDFDYDRQFQDGSPQDYTIPPENKETENQNPYTEAGYKTGDVVLYDWGNGRLEELELEMSDNSSGNDNSSENQMAGAWLIERQKNGSTRRANESPAIRPEKCQIYKFPTGAAVNRYKEMLASPTLDSKEKLFALFDAMARSGIQPKDVNIQMNADPQGKWTEVKNKVDEIEAGTAIIEFMTSANKLRSKIRELFPNAVSKGGSNEKRGDSVDHLNGKQKQKDDIELVITDLEKMAKFEQLGDGDEIRLGKMVFRKASNTIFFKSTDKVASTKTVEGGLVTRNDLVRLINVLDNDNIEIIKHSDTELPVVEEDPEKLARIYKDFGQIENQLMPQRWYNRKEIIKYIETSEIKQGEFVGDCYLIAAINSIKKTHPELYYQTLARTIQKGDKEGEWKVTFQGAEDSSLQAEPIVVTQEDIDKWRARGATANLADIILERAYSSLKSLEKNGVRGMTMVLDAKNRMALEGGFGHRALDDILGSEIARKYKIGDYGHYDGARSLVENGKAESVREFFQIQYAKNPKNYIITANTPYEKNGRPLDDTRYEMFNGNKLYYKHAYSVTGFSGNEVRLVNPHDTTKRFSMDMANFLNFFSQLSYVEIQAKYEK